MTEGHDLNIPIRVISLKDSVERQEHMKTQLESLDLKYSVFSAVDGDLLSQDEIYDAYDEISALSIRGKHLELGEIGVALSHIRLLQELVDNQLKAVLVLEDDVDIDPEIKSVIKQIHNYPGDWDFVFLGCDSRRVFLKSIPHGKQYSDKFELTQALGVGPVKGAYAYMVNYSGAKKLLESTIKFYQPIDSYTGDNSVLNIYVFKPNIISHPHVFPSTRSLKLLKLLELQKDQAKIGEESIHYFNLYKLRLHKIKPAYRKFMGIIYESNGATFSKFVGYLGS